MKYQALYRKYRPSKFEDVVGQDIVIKTLRNSLKVGKISHAYMFSGPRGTGKTSIAKLFAKTINCLDNSNGDSCNNCKNCFSIINNECTDVIEIDAASNNGVDEIREIKNKITLVPNELKYKVYIIDEVHMLSIGAFNALLKTLEEPPSHIIFILATTDPHKVPVTIISRCQCFEFKRISNDDIVYRLSQICQFENISIDNDVLNRIAVYSDGGLRDAIGLLDKLVSYTSDTITMEDLNNICGLLSYDYHEKFLNLIINKKSLEIIEEIDKIYDQGKDFIVFTQELMDLIKKKLLESLKTKTNNTDTNMYLKLLSNFNDMVGKLKQTDNIKIVFEVGILSSFYNKNDIEIISREIISESKEFFSVKDTNINSKSNEFNTDIQVKNNNVIDKPSIVKDVADINKIKIDYEKMKRIYINNTFASASKNKKMEVLQKWEALNEYVLDIEYGATACYLIDSTVEAVGDSNMILSVKYEFSIDRIMECLYKIDFLLTKILGKSYKIAFLTAEEWALEKKNYIANKNTIQYTYIDELSMCDDREKNIVNNTVSTDNLDVSSINDDEEVDENIVSKAINLFGENIVEVK